jgi:hypothetical protein
LVSFIETVWNGDADLLRGVFIPGLASWPVVQQPDGSPGFVSQNFGELTQFGMVADAGNVGLLAHNYLSGIDFSHLAPGDGVILVYGDGHTETFLVTQVLQYQALDPENPYSQFRDLVTQEVLPAENLFDKVYRGERHVTFQTCITAEGNLSWGRLFVIAEPVSNLPLEQKKSLRGNE